MMSRRTLLTRALVATAVPGGFARASKTPPIVGFVGFASAEGDRLTLAAFRDGLAALGWREGRDVVIEAHSVAGDLQKGHTVISALTTKPVDVFLSPGPATTRAIVSRTRIPVVAIGLPPGPDGEGLYASLARPGGTVTGLSTFGEELSAKRIEVLREILPNAHTFCVLHIAIDPTFSRWGNQTIEDLARQRFDPKRLPLSAASPTEVAKLVSGLRDAGGQAIIVIRDFLTSSLTAEICAFAGESSLAVVSEQRDFVRAGALFSYGPDHADLFRRAAGYVDRILRGEPAANLPIELPTKFELVVNKRAARSLGLTLPTVTVVRADDVIE